MSTTTGVRAALGFLSAVRRDDLLRRRVSALDADGGLEAVVVVAAEAGFVFSEDDLQAAFAHDWGMRRARQLADERPAAKAASTVAVVNTPPLSM